MACNAVALLVALAMSGCSVASTAWRTGSVYRSRCTHVGVRGHLEGADGALATVQVTTDAPSCPEVYPP